MAPTNFGAEEAKAVGEPTAESTLPLLQGPASLGTPRQQVYGTSFFSCLTKCWAHTGSQATFAE